MSPAAIAPLVVWLCSDLARDVNGQVFAVSGARIQLVRGFHPIAQIDADGREWSVDRIESLREGLLDGADTGIPPFLPPVQ
jgi:hypothetical protein